MPKFWKAALGIAGIGAIGFFVFWSLYRKWLSLPIFPELTQEQASELLKIFLFLTFGALVIAVLSFFLTHNSRRSNLVPVQSENLRMPNGNRFTDAQFETYKNVWIALQEVRNAGDALWAKASRKNLDSFIKILNFAKRKISESSIFFERTDYEQLNLLLEEFLEFANGKEGLIELLYYEDINSSNIRKQIKKNEYHLKEYSKILDSVRENYHDQLNWEKAG